MSAAQDIQRALRDYGPTLVKRILVRATLGDAEAERALLPYVLPRATKQAVSVSARVEIDISSLAAAKLTLARVASAIGEGILGLDEGHLLLDAVGKAVDRMTMADVNDLAARLALLEAEQAAAPLRAMHGAAEPPRSRANGHTPDGWGNIVMHPSLKVVGDE